MKDNITVVLTVHNGEKYLTQVLKSAGQLTTEIVVVDSESTDNTHAIASKYAKHIFTAKNNPQKIDIQKNFGFNKVTTEWILSLDADEEISPELCEEIKELLKTDPIHDGYEIPRRNIIFGKEIRYAGWSPDYQLRLFRHNKGKYKSDHVHERLSLNGTVGRLKYGIVHYNYDSVAQYLRKMIIYAENEADNLLKNNYAFRWKDVLLMPHKEFLSRYFAREGYRDGLHGLVLSLLQGVYHLCIFCFLWEKRGFVTVSDEKISQDFEHEIYKMHKEGLFWLVSQKIDNTKSMSKKMKLRLLRKLKFKL